jgi:hypothetical protein
VYLLKKGNIIILICDFIKIMRKFITKILLTSIILLWFWNINQTKAEDLGGFESLFWEVNNEFSCSDINYDIKRYTNNKKVFHIFNKYSYWNIKYTFFM